MYPVSTTSLVRHRAGAGEPLVLLHGVGESAVGWRPVQDALSRDYDVIALDFPGFGGSAKLPADALPSAVALADAVEREMDQLGIGDFHVAGYSLGARVSLELATRGRIRSVVAIAPDGLGTPPERVYQATALMAGRTMATLLAPVATLMTASGPGRSLFFAMERSLALEADPAGRPPAAAELRRRPGLRGNRPGHHVRRPDWPRPDQLPRADHAGNRRPPDQHAISPLPHVYTPRAVQLALRPQSRPHLRRPRTRHQAHARFPSHHSGRRVLPESLPAPA